MSEKSDRSDKSDKSDKRLAKIEKALEKIAVQQSDLCAEVSRLAGKLDASSGSGADASKLIEFLDQFRAGEALGEASLGAWIAVSDTACLRGGLRTVQMREGMHARLLEQRISLSHPTPRLSTSPLGLANLHARWHHTSHR